MRSAHIFEQYFTLFPIDRLVSVPVLKGTSQNDMSNIPSYLYLCSKHMKWHTRFPLFLFLLTLFLYLQQWQK